MNKILSNIGITSGSLIEAHHVSQSIDALTGADGYDITISGSLTVTGSLYFNDIPSNSGYNNILTIDSTKILYTSSLDIIVKGALTASYIDLVEGDSITINQVGTSFEISNSIDLIAGPNITINQTGNIFTISSSVGGGGFVTYPDFNSFTSSYNTGSFTGSFKGNLLGTASYVNLVEGPNIDINQTGNVFAISGSSSVNTGSFLITASISSNIITFTKGDSSTFPIVLSINLVPTSSFIKNQYDIAPPVTYQIPSGNCILYYVKGGDTDTGLTFLLPTSSFFLGDTLEFIIRSLDLGNSPNDCTINQTSSQQILGDSYFQNTYGQMETTIGSFGTLKFLNNGLTYQYGNSFILTCVETSSVDTNYAKWILSYNWGTDGAGFPGYNQNVTYFQFY